MTYNLNGKNIRIPDAEINKSMKLLGISHDEAVQMWLEDEGYLENEVVEELTAKAKANKVNHEAKANKPRKSDLIEILANCLKNAGFEAEITNKSKIIEFNVNSNHYKLDLIKQRPPKK